MDDSQKLIQGQFGAHADSYATSKVHAQGESLARLRELTQPKRYWRMLDVSTGAGHAALAFASHVEHVVACDLTPEMLATAQRLAAERAIANIEFKPADAQALPFEDSVFDLLTNRLALHHYADARKAIAEMARVCKSGGIVALTDNIVPPDKQTAGYINRFEKLRDPSHKWAYPLVRLEAYFGDAKLQVEHTEEFRKEMEFEPWADRMGANEETNASLRQLLLESPEGVRTFLTPRVEGHKLFFTLHEAIIISRKT
jgi:ubiquinone/menaquinone biosynthesis C-methylase UbiE